MTDYVTLTFRLDEQVTPGIFAEKVAEACFSYGALRPSEAVVHPEFPGVLEFIDNGKVML